MKTTSTKILRGFEPGWFGRLMDRLFPEIGSEIEVRIAENARGGFSIFPANDAARQLFAAPGESADSAAEVGNFGTYADAYRRAARDNCWTVVDAPAAAAAPADSIIPATPAHPRS